MEEDRQMNQIDALKSAIRLLNKAQFPYMITGAYAVSYYGEPRATHDLDIVVEISRTDIEKIRGIFRNDDYEFDQDMIDNAVTYSRHNLFCNLAVRPFARCFYGG